jgi:hypothetical protein
MSSVDDKSEGKSPSLAVPRMQYIPDLLFNEWLVGLGVPVLIGIAFALLSDEFKEFMAAKVLLVIAAGWAYGKAIFWATGTQVSFTIRALTLTAAGAALTIGLVETIRLANRREATLSAEAHPPKSLGNKWENKDEKRSVPSRSPASTANARSREPRTFDATNPLGSLAQLGWAVKDTQDATTFEIVDKPLPDMRVG